VVIDVGKTQSKVSLWAPDGALVDRRSRSNERVQGPGYVALDVVGIEAWLAEVLTQFARLAPVTAIVPVAHGAAIALVRQGALLLPPMDYENEVPEEVRLHYETQRGDFSETGSPALPRGLNLGVQLHWLQSLHPQALQPGTQLLPWAQYWAWRLCGVAASEVTSLGCHTDLWNPLAGAPSRLAVQRGWAAWLAPMRRAADCLGTLSAEWVTCTGLSPRVEVHCGLHDSNAALLAARGARDPAGGESTLLSTGTWFVAMRSTTRPIDFAALSAQRDCLVNVDVLGRPVPSSRFMGGREIEVLGASDTPRLDNESGQQGMLAALAKVLMPEDFVLPTFAPGCGPFPGARGQWTTRPPDPFARGAAIGLYAALVADASLDLVGARDRLVVEGRFANSQVFVRALATLRTTTRVQVVNPLHDVSFGALRLLDPVLAPDAGLTGVEPLAMDLDTLRHRWRVAAQRMEQAA
jgi:sugar (pentulose or hexulose) kinase